MNMVEPLDGPRELGTFERALLARLFARAFPGRDALAAQAETARVTWLRSPGAPALLFQVDASTPVADVARRIPVEAEGRDLDGESVHFLLHVIDGRMAEVEIYREDGASLSRMPDPAELSVMTLDE